MSTRREIEDLFLHVDDGKIYYGFGDGRYTKFKGDVADFVEEEWLEDVVGAKVLGMANNASLITALHNNRLKHGRPAKVMIGGPRRMKLRSLSDIFQRLPELDSPPSVGGWHSMTSADYSTYALIQSMQSSGGVLDDLSRHHLKSHPAWQALEFIPSTCELSAARLLTLWVDPRWHVSPVKPDRSSGMKAFFGLDDRLGVKHVAVYLGQGKRSRSVAYSRAELVLDTWSSGWQRVTTQNVVGPRDFLMRMVKYWTRVESPQPAMLNTSHVFLRFVRDVWLDNLTEHRVYDERVVSSGKGRKKKMKYKRTVMAPAVSYSPSLFVPNYFFSNKDEVEAWMQHAYS